MIITLVIYIAVLSIIIFKGFCKSIPFMAPFSVRKNTEILTTSIQIESIPFFLNQNKINLFSFFINFFLITLTSFILIPELIYNNMVFCMEASDDTGNSTDSGSIHEPDLDSFILSEESIQENIELEYERIFKKNIKYTAYLGNSSKSFSNNYNFKIFKEINNEMDILVQKKIDIFKTITYKYNPNILDIRIEDFINILDDLNYNCHKTRFIFLKCYFDVIQSKIEHDRLENWVKIFSKIHVFQAKALPINIIDIIFDFTFNRGICNYFKNLIDFTNYINFLINTIDSITIMLRNNNEENLLGSLEVFKLISYELGFNYFEQYSLEETKEYEIKKKLLLPIINTSAKLTVNSDLLPFYIFSSFYLSQNTEGDIFFEELLKGETHYLFNDRQQFLLYFDEHKRSQNELLSNNDISMDERNNIISKKSVFYSQKDIKSYLISKNFSVEKCLCSTKFNFIESFGNIINSSSKKAFFDLEEEKNNTPPLKRLKR